MAGYGAGIDLGTTSTVVAAAGDGRAEAIGLGDRGPAMPSVVVRRPDGTFLVGDAAERRALTEPGAVAREFKRRVGDPVPLIVGGTPLSADTLFARLIGHAYRVVTERHGRQADHVVLTHPASWGPYKLDVLTGAARLAGIEPLTGVSLLSEPEAAALHYASVAPLARGATVAVYDLGGGTFDAAVLRRTVDGSREGAPAGQRAFELLGRPEGIERFGGTDIDAAVLDHVRAAVGPGLDDLDPDDPNTAAAVSALRRACTEAKVALSADVSTVVAVALPGLHTQVRIHRSELEARIRPPLVDTIDALARTVASAGLEPADLDAVLLVGGSSRLPLVAELITATLGTPVGLDVDPELAVALGAAALAARRARRPPSVASHPVVRPRTEPEPDADRRVPAESAPHPLTTTATAPPDRVRRPGAQPGVRPPGRGGAPPVVTPIATRELAPPSRADAPAPTPRPAAAGRRRRLPLLGAGALAVAATVAALLSFGGDDDAEDEVAAIEPTTDGDPVGPAGAIDIDGDVGTDIAIESILFRSSADGRHAIWEIDPDGGNPRPFITTDDAVDLLPTLSRDRTRLAWLRGPSVDPGATFELMVASVEEPGDPRSLLSGLPRFTRAGWLPDASALLVPVDGVLVRIDPTTGERSSITLAGAAEGCQVADPQVSPDATLVAFQCNRAGDPVEESSLFVAEIDGGDSRLLTDGLGIDSDPWWSPDGTELVIRSDRDGDPDLYVIAADGGEPRPLTANDVIDQDPAWLPDDTIAFSQSAADGETQDLFRVDVVTGEERPLLVRDEVDGIVAG